MHIHPLPISIQQSFKSTIEFIGSTLGPINLKEMLEHLL
jgi:hypothetical protein